MSGTKKRINRRELGKIALASAAAFDAAQRAPACFFARAFFVGLAFFALRSPFAFVGASAADVFDVPDSLLILISP